jgi:hypothetical protein
MQRIIIKKCFLFTVTIVCRLKRFTTESRNSLNFIRKSQKMKRCCGSGWDNSQKIICCGFRRTDKATRQVYQCWWKTCREINVFFFSFEYHLFYIYLSPIYWLSLVVSCLKVGHDCFLPDSFQSVVSWSPCNLSWILDGPISIAFRLGAGRPRTPGSIPGRGNRIIFSPQCPHRFRRPTNLLHRGYAGDFLGGKVVGVWICPFISL